MVTYRGGIEVSGGRLGARPGWARLGAATVVVVGLAGCGDGPEPGGALPSGCPPTSAVADVVGDDGVSAGASGGTGSAGAVDYMSQGCLYRFGPNPAAPAATVRIDRLSSERTELFSLLTADARNPDFPRPFEPVTGLGDDARVDGEELAVLTSTAVVFVRVEAVSAPAADPIASATLVAEAVVALGLDHVAPPDCEALVESVTGALGSLNPTVAPAPASGDRQVGDVPLPVRGCRFDMADGAVTHISLADPAQWTAWVHAKARSPARSRFVEGEVDGRRAVQLVTALMVEDGSEVVRVQTQEIAGDDAELDRIRVALAELVLP